jgi:hypothetical protein
MVMLGSMVVLGNKFMKRQIGQYVMKEVDFETMPIGTTFYHVTYNLDSDGWEYNKRPDGIQKTA